MNASELKYNVENRGKDSHFFTRRTMKFFGDTMRNYGVRKAQVATNYDDAGNYVSAAGVVVECWELYRRRPVKHGLSDSVYFNAQTYAKVDGAVI